ncbi:MAG: hypothetical protein LKKZDAJK_001093 [Candidatus Fervidibacter sp.]
MGKSVAWVGILMSASLLLGCGGGGHLPTSVPNFPSNAPLPASRLTAAEVAQIVERAARAANDNTMVIAVVDRAGRVLGLFKKANAPATYTTTNGQTFSPEAVAVALARTAAFFSHDQAPLSSRTVRYISGRHFPPGVQNTPNGALWGIEHTNRGFVRADNLAGLVLPDFTGWLEPLVGMVTGKADLADTDATAVNPGGVPIYKNGHCVGGIGVTVGSAGIPSAAPSRADYERNMAIAEWAAFHGAFGDDPTQFLGAFLQTLPPPKFVVVDGIALPFVRNTQPPAGVMPDGSGFPTPMGKWVVEPATNPSIGQPLPDEMGVQDANGAYLLGPIAADLNADGNPTMAEVNAIVQACIAIANRTRAVIRLPVGSRCRFVFAIAVPDTPPRVVAVYRMRDATMFSVDVAVTKAVNMVHFNTAEGQEKLEELGLPTHRSGQPWALTNRTLNFGSQPFYPPGIDGSAPGPFFKLFQDDFSNPGTQGGGRGIVWFAGSVPLYRNGVLVGGLGVSGDGVEQDDYVAVLGNPNGFPGYEPPVDRRIDNLVLNGVRLPWLKFPRNPEG